MQPYWLDLVCPESAWDVVLSHDETGEIRGAWTYVKGSTLGMTTIRLPVITPFTGIWLEVTGDQPLQKQIAIRHEILSALLDNLPKAHIFELKVHWPLQDWLPMYWRGYRQETRYTFRFPEVRVDQIHENFSKSFRRNLRAAERHYTIDTGTAAQLYPMMERVFEMRDAHTPLSQDHLARIVQGMTTRGQGHIYAARDEGGIQASVFVVWDDSTTYYLLGGRNRTDSRHGNNLLLWQAIQDAAQRGHAFDFEGSMIEGVNQFFQTFGAELTPYFFIYKYRGPARLKYLQ